MKKLRIFGLLVLFMLIFSCHKGKSLQNQSKMAETPSPNNEYKNAYDSITTIKIDTTTLEGKRLKIFNQFMLEHGLIAAEDSLFDLNYDGIKDYVLNYYGQSGTGLKNKVIVYLFDSDLNAYIKNEELSQLSNPSYFLDDKKISSFYIANGGGAGEQLEWKNNKWVVTKTFDVDFNREEREHTKWHVKYPLEKSEEIIIHPYKFTPPKEVLENNY